MNYKIKEIPLHERPRERLSKHSASALLDHELLAIIIRTGTKKISAIEVAKNVIITFQSLEHLNEATIKELMMVEGIGQTKAIELLAAIELGKRINQPNECQIILKSPNQVYQYVKDKLHHLNQEKLLALFLNSRSKIISERVITIGTMNRTIFSPREILKWALKYSAAAIIIVHNHPSGDPMPSADDLKVTYELIAAAKMLDIVIVDHLIVGKNKYYSFLEHNDIE